MERLVCLSLGIALPLAVIRCGGWLGFAAQLLAILGTAFLLDRTNQESTANLSGVEFAQGETQCARGRSRTS
jgi:hypothetical protein